MEEITEVREETDVKEVKRVKEVRGGEGMRMTLFLKRLCASALLAAGFFVGFAAQASDAIPEVDPAK